MWAALVSAHLPCTPARLCRPHWTTSRALPSGRSIQPYWLCTHNSWAGTLAYIQLNYTGALQLGAVNNGPDSGYECCGVVTCSYSTVGLTSTGAVGTQFEQGDRDRRWCLARNNNHCHCRFAKNPLEDRTAPLRFDNSHISNLADRRNSGCARALGDW